MASSVAKKLHIKESYRLLTIHAPDYFIQSLDGLPPQVEIGADLKRVDQIHWFVKTKAAMEEELPEVLSLLTGEVVCWIYFPKGSSKIQTDLTRDTGWELLLKSNDLQWLSLISFDETWSAFGVRRKTESDQKKAVAPKPRPIFNFIDPEKKVVHLPEYLAKALSDNKAENQFFESLSFTNRKEYVEWVISAKREETRNNRVRETIERLRKGWKNPANR